MGTYGQFCPVAVGSEILTERWTPVLLREFLAGSRRFNELRRGVPLMSPSLLSKRLKTLERQGIVERIPSADGRGAEYRLTEAGVELAPVVEGIGRWALRWARSESNAPERSDASLLFWDIRRGVAVDAAPERRLVLHFRVQGSIDGKSRFWLVIDRGEVDLCMIDPGFEVDVTAELHVSTLVDIWLGDRSFGDAMRQGDMTVDGPSSLVRLLPRLLPGSPMVASLRN